MFRFLAALGCLALAIDSLPAQPRKDPVPTPLVLTPSRPPIPSLRFALLPELREQIPGNGAILYGKAVKLLNRTPPLQSQRAALFDLMDRWGKLPLASLPGEEVRKVLDLYKEPLELLHRAARCEHCDFEISQRLREKGFEAPLPEIQRLRSASVLLNTRARLELAEDHPDLALKTLQTGYALGRDVGKEPALICALVGVAITARTNQVLELALRHPRTPNLSGSLAVLPRPFLDMRRAFEGERLSAYASFPGLLEVVNNPDAGALPPEQIEKWKKTLALIGFNDLKVPVVEHALLAALIRGKHETAKKALIAAGRTADRIEKWPHIQVAMMHSLLEFDQVFDEMTQALGSPYWQVAERLEAFENKVRRSRIPGPDSPAIPLAPLVLPAVQKVLLARERLERQFTAFRIIEAIRLYAANHEGKLPPTLAHIKEVPLPVCPLTGKSFEYRPDGEVALLSAPPAPKSAGNSIQPLHYEIILRQAKDRKEVQP